MTQEDLTTLQPGDTIRHVESGNAYIVTDQYRQIAVRTMHYGNAEEWQHVPLPERKQAPDQYEGAPVHYVVRFPVSQDIELNALNGALAVFEATHTGAAQRVRVCRYLLERARAEAEVDGSPAQ